MKTLYLAIITLAGIGSLVGLGAYIFTNPIINEPTQSGSNYMGSMQGPPFISKMEIIGLHQNYTVGQEINATVSYTKYSQGGAEPDLEILDPYGELVWNNYPSNLTGTPTISSGTYIIKALQPVEVCQGGLVNNHCILELRRPVFNSAGNYTMIASFDNKTIQQVFKVIDDTNMTYPSTAPNEPVYHDYPNPPQYSIVNATVGIPVENDTVASKMVGFKVSSPTYLPAGYEVKLIKVAKDIPWVTIFASRYPLTDKTTSEQFMWLDKGIEITYSIADKRALDYNRWTLLTPQANKVMVDGNQAVIDNIRKLDFHGHPYDMWADLAMFKGNVDIGVRGFLSEDNLVKITASMLENQK